MLPVSYLINSTRVSPSMMYEFTSDSRARYSFSNELGGQATSVVGPSSADHYRGLYPEGSYGPARSNWKQIALRIKELCEQYGISDRIPRPIIPGDKRTLNKLVVEALANQLYYMELNGEPSRRVWAYRKAAWAIEDTPQDLGLIYRQMGRKGLESIENVGSKLAGVIELLLRQWT